jgi:chromosome partitioning protein
MKNLSVGLASKGFSVLVIDLDPSANLTKCLGLNPGPNEEGSICEILGRTIDCEDISPAFGIVHSDEEIDVITSSNALHFYETKLSQAYQREIVLRRYLAPIKDLYDYIFLDCPAGLGIFVDNALFAADSIIIPTEANFLDIEAMQNLFSKISMVRKLNGTGKKPEIMGIVFTSVRLSTNNNKAIMNQLRESYKGKVNIFNSYICLNSKIPESDLARQSIFKYAKNCTAALNYMDLVNEFIEIEKQN